MRNQAPLPSFRLRFLLLILALILTTSGLAATALATESTPAALPPLPEPTAVVSEPTNEPVPTAVPPTAVPPTAVPTSIPPKDAPPPPPAEVPTPVPTEPISPTEPPQALPSLTPSDPDETLPNQQDPDLAEPPTVPESQHASTPASQDPTASGSPTPPVTPVPNTDSIALSPAVGPVVLEPGEIHEAQITYAVTTERRATAIHLELRGADGILATDWQLSLRPGEPSGSAVANATDTTAIAGGTSFTVAVWIQAPVEVSEEHSVSLFITSTVTTPSGDEQAALTPDAVSVVLTVRPLPEEERTDPQASDVSLACTPETTFSMGTVDPINVSCSFKASESLTDRSVTISQVLIYAPDGWSVSTSASSQSGALLVEPGRTLGAGDEFDLDFSVLPAVCEAGSGAVAIRTTLTGPEGNEVLVDGPEAAISTDVVPPVPGLPNVDISSLTFGSIERTDGGYGPVTGVMSISFLEPTVTECGAVLSSWSVQVGTGGLTESERGDGVIPAESITYLGTLSAVDAPSGVSPVGTDIPLTSGQMTTVAYGNELSGEGGTWNAVFQLDPPDDLPAGVYGGDITVMIINGP